MNYIKKLIGETVVGKMFRLVAYQGARRGSRRRGAYSLWFWRPRKVPPGTKAPTCPPRRASVLTNSFLICLWAHTLLLARTEYSKCISSSNRKRNEKYNFLICIQSLLTKFWGCEGLGTFCLWFSSAYFRLSFWKEKKEKSWIIKISLKKRQS